jgi:hypothetical protein
LISIIYFFDVLIKFRTTFYQESFQKKNDNTRKAADSSYEVFDPLLIAKNYIISWKFYLDMFSFIPFNLIFWGFLTFDQRSFVAAISMLKIYRVFRFTNLIQKLNVTRESKAIFKVLLLIFFLVLFLHI